jgi:hypothetical protein
VEATLNKIFAGSRDEVPLSEVHVEPRVAQAGRGTVEETLVDMEAADKLMHREGRVHPDLIPFPL